MPKPVKNLPTLTEIRSQAARDAKRTPRKPSNDPMIHARQIITEHMAKAGEQTEPLPAPLDFQAQYKAHMAKLGAKGGKISGAKRMEMPERTRKAIARKAAAARWKGHNQG